MEYGNSVGAAEERDPQRYPMNEDSIGIEVVARDSGTAWEPPTPRQQAAIGRLVRILQQQFGPGR